MIKIGTLSMLFGFVLLSHAQAAETRKPRTIYYPVKGQTAKAIRDDIVNNGPKIGGGSAFSFTIPAIKINMKTKTKDGKCRFGNYRISSVFTFVLPKLQAGTGLPRQSAINWKNFAAYLAIHENQHRTIWLQCFSEFEQQALSLTGRDCAGLERDVARAFERQKLSCLEADRKLDFDYTKEALKTPFLQEAMGRK